jgi:hypothetical protein
MEEAAGRADAAEPIAEILRAGGLSFAFRLWRHRNEVPFGRASAQQFWMDTGTLYGQRGRHAPNLQPMADYFWVKCCTAGTYLDADTQESYLLAHLCPHVRGTAAQKVFPDARLSRPGGSSAARWRDAAELEPLLAAMRRSPRPEERRLTMAAFSKKTADLVGMPHYSRKERQAYRELCEELFGVVRPVLIERNPGAATDLLIGKWQEMTSRVGRRSGGAVRLKKTAMDMLSYESRAAVHRCYSCAWNDLIPHLLRKYSLSEPSVRLLHLMHLERVSDSRTPGSSFHLFHGHVFALHPAVSALTLTPTGRELIGDYLLAPTAEELVEPFQRLLAAVYASLYFYAHRREQSAEKRGGRRGGSKH